MQIKNTQYRCGLLFKKFSHPFWKIIFLKGMCFYFVSSLFVVYYYGVIV